MQTFPLTALVVALSGIFGCLTPSPALSPELRMPRDLQARYQNNDVLLLRAKDRQFPVYAYKLDDHRLAVVKSDVWANAGGRIVTNNDRNAMSSSAAHFQMGRKHELLFRFYSKENGRVAFHTRPIADYTRPVLEGSNVGDSVVVLTCTQYRPTDFLFGGGERIQGPYYFRYFNPKTGEACCPDTRLPFADDSGRVRLCITEDDRFLVFADAKFSNVCVVPVEREAKHDRNVRLLSLTNLDDETGGSAAAASDPPVDVRLVTTDMLVPLSSTVPISIAVLESGRPVAGASVVVHMQALDFSDPETTLTLADGGESGDDKGGDGLYSAGFTPTRTGVHSLIAKITGTRSDRRPFARKTATQFRVFSTGASLAGGLTDHGVDTNSDGWLESVRFDQRVDVNTSGTFGLFVYGHTPSGKSIYALGHATLPPGNQLISAQIRTFDFLAFGENGPYLIDRLELRREDSDLGFETIAHQSFDPPFETAAYRLTQFDRPAIKFLGMVSDTGVDTDADGKFDVLRIVANVVVRTSGNFKIGGQVADGCHRRIAWGDAQQALTADQPQQIVLDFPGSDIGKHGVAGPYRVRSLTIARLGSSPPESLIVNTVGQTGYYKASAFRSFSDGSADCNENGQPDDCECLGDLNGDSQVSSVDVELFLLSFGLHVGEPDFNPAADFDGDGSVSLADYACLVGRYGGRCWQRSRPS